MRYISVDICCLRCCYLDVVHFQKSKVFYFMTYITPLNSPVGPAGQVDDDQTHTHRVVNHVSSGAKRLKLESETSPRELSFSLNGRVDRLPLFGLPSNVSRLIVTFLSIEDLYRLATGSKDLHRSVEVIMYQLKLDVNSLFNTLIVMLQRSEMSDQFLSIAIKSFARDYVPTEIAQWGEKHPSSNYFFKSHLTFYGLPFSQLRVIHLCSCRALKKFRSDELKGFFARVEDLTIPYGLSADLEKIFSAISGLKKLTFTSREIMEIEGPQDITDIGPLRRVFQSAFLELHFFGVPLFFNFLDLENFIEIVPSLRQIRLVSASFLLSAIEASFLLGHYGDYNLMLSRLAVIIQKVEAIYVPDDLSVNVLNGLVNHDMGTKIVDIQRFSEFYRYWNFTNKSAYFKVIRTLTRLNLFSKNVRHLFLNHLINMLRSLTHFSIGSYPEFKNHLRRMGPDQMTLLFGKLCFLDVSAASLGWDDLLKIKASAPFLKEIRAMGADRSDLQDSEGADAEFYMTKEVENFEPLLTNPESLSEICKGIEILWLPESCPAFILNKILHDFPDLKIPNILYCKNLWNALEGQDLDSQSNLLRSFLTWALLMKHQKKILIQIPVDFLLQMIRIQNGFESVNQQPWSQISLDVFLKGQTVDARFWANISNHELDILARRQSPFLLKKHSLDFTSHFNAIQGFTAFSFERLMTGISPLEKFGTYLNLHFVTFLYDMTSETAAKCFRSVEGLDLRGFHVNEPQVSHYHQKFAIIKILRSCTILRHLELISVSPLVILDVLREFSREELKRIFGNLTRLIVSSCYQQSSVLIDTEKEIAARLAHLVSPLCEMQVYNYEIPLSKS